MFDLYSMSADPTGLRSDEADGRFSAYKQGSLDVETPRRRRGV